MRNSTKLNKSKLTLPHVYEMGPQGPENYTFSHSYESENATKMLEKYASPFSSYNWHFEICSYFTKFIIYLKWKEAWLLVIKMVYRSCPMSCRTS